MTDETNTLAPESDILETSETNSTASAPEPAFLIRARRILDGDIRPEDYLSVTPEVCRRVELFLDAANARGNGQALAQEVEPRQMRLELLSFFHGGQNIAYIEDGRGVIVLAVGLEQSSALIEHLPEKISGRVCFGVPTGDELWI